MVQVMCEPAHVRSLFLAHKVCSRSASSVIKCERDRTTSVEQAEKEGDGQREGVEASEKANFGGKRCVE
jgi:hypothetical protein